MEVRRPQAPHPVRFIRFNGLDAQRPIMPHADAPTASSRLPVGVVCVDCHSVILNSLVAALPAKDPCAMGGMRQERVVSRMTGEIIWKPQHPAEIRCRIFPIIWRESSSGSGRASLRYMAGIVFRRVAESGGMASPPRARTLLDGRPASCAR